ncbi:hypothetical protein [Streptomyces sp. NPDC056010]|uniref:hypothetical protein n=1 Tax=Streptomyces sp. NPDC056010 TaxID=3345679 RepID=UPI0035D9D5EE
MGLDLMLFMADWKYLSALPVEKRTEALEDAAFPPLKPDCEYPRGRRDGGWVWLPDPETAWCAEYEFNTTTGAYRPHSHAGDAWDDMRPLVDAFLREAVDTFLIDLIWQANPADDPALTSGGRFFPAATDRRHPRVLLACPPEAMPGKARAWTQVQSRLEALREPFDLECEGWAGRPSTFNDFTTLLGEWGAVTTEAARRGWGLVGLP